MPSNPFSSIPSDLRRSPRFIFHRPATLHLDGRRSLSVRTVDISLEGICITADLSLPVGNMCVIEFNASYTVSPSPLRLEAKVAYCVLAGAAGFRIGLHLPKLDSGARKHIENIISMQKF